MNMMDVDQPMMSPTTTDDPNTDPDGEGVWSPEIEQCFQEALILFPPCGRRKHILQEEGGGKMYGRNELISRHIFLQTGKHRTRKQVSSHIQVLARRRAKVDGGSSIASGSGTPSPSSIRSATSQSMNGNRLQMSRPLMKNDQTYFDVWPDRPIVTQRIRLVEFSAFIEQRNPQHDCSPLQSTVLSPAYPPSYHQPPAPTCNPHCLPANMMAANQQSPYASHPTSAYQAVAAVTAAAANDSNMSPSSLESLGTDILTHSNHQSVNGTNPLARPPPLTRHSFISVDYSRNFPKQQQPKLERIDIGQIQDKFPDLMGPEGLYGKCPSDGFYLIKFWADISNDHNTDDQNSYFGFSTHLETIDLYKDITCSTRACSYGQQVVEKVDKLYPRFNNSNGRYSYALNRSPMCEFMIHFIKKLRQLPRASQMNSVLENFTCLQVITGESPSEVLLCLAYVFEVDSSARVDGRSISSHRVYKLMKD